MKKNPGSLQSYYRDEPNNPLAASYNADPITNSSSFKYKTSITGKTSNTNQENGEDTQKGNTKTKKILEIVVPLKHLSSFRRTLDMPLINCEVSMTLTWSGNCVLTDITKQAARTAQGGNPARPAINAPTNATFQITDTKLYLPLVTLSTENDKKLLKQLRTGFKRTTKWSKYRSKMTHQTKNNLNYLIDPTFTKVNRLFVLSFENENDETSFSKYYVPNVQRKDFNVLISGKTFLDLPIKNDEEKKYEQIIEMERNNDYRTGNLLDYEYF